VEDNVKYITAIIASLFLVTSMPAVSVEVPASATQTARETKKKLKLAKKKAKKQSRNSKK
jgi:hypothetical protein